jgi:TolB-like protein
VPAVRCPSAVAIRRRLLRLVSPDGKIRNVRAPPSSDLQSDASNVRNGSNRVIQPGPPTTGMPEADIHPSGQGERLGESASPLCDGARILLARGLAGPQGSHRRCSAAVVVSPRQRRNMGGTRKLAAILVADVVGYSRLAGADEDRILARLRTLRSDLIEPTIAVHHGRIVKGTGDGSIVEFRSVVEAVRCGIEIQNGLIDRNAGVPEDRRIEIRVGIHVGDVVEESDGDLMGDGVNIAARLEGIAKPGAICLSEDAYRQVKGRLELPAVDLGPQRLKNIAEPIHVYALEVGQTAKPPVQEKSAPPRLSIVVLPFANLSGDPQQEYFADGVTESLTTDLSRMRGSFVIARNTAFTYKGRPVDLRQMGRELNVRYALEGSVQRAGNRVRVSVQLIDAATGAHLWAERFDKPVADFFDMQDEIVARLASQLNVELVSAEARRAATAPNPDAFDLTLQGADWFMKGHTSERNLREAAAYFDRALALDSENPTALVYKGFVDFNYATYFFADDTKARLEAAEAAAAKALSLAPENAFAHFCLGIVLATTGRIDQGIAECERALTLNPNLASAHATIGFYKAFVGRAAETEPHVREALRLSPRDPSLHIWLMMVGASKITLERNDEAVVWLRRSIEANRNNPMSHFWLSAALALLGRPEEARAAAKAGLALNPQFSIARYRALTDRIIVHSQPRERLIEGMRMAGVPEE